jgi:hypothetical protein
VANTADTDPGEPIFRHDCERCVFLGTCQYEERDYDLYFCKQGHFFPTIIARGSSDPHDYTSGLALAAVDPVLREAYERSKERGFIAMDSQPENEDG